MNPISATVQKPAPKADRDVASLQQDADSRNAPGAERRRDFHAAMRQASVAPDASRAEADASAADADASAADVDGPSGKADPQAPATPAVAPPPLADPAASAAAVLASLLNTARPGAVAGTGPTDVPTTGANDGGPQRPAVAGASATAGSGPNAAGPAGTLALARGDARTEAAQSGAVLGATPTVAVLDRAVHFKPVIAAAAPPGPTRPGPVAVPTADAAKPQPLRATLPDLVAAAAKVAPRIPVPLQAEPRPADAASVAAPGPDRADLTALTDSRAVTGIVRAVLDADGHPESKDASARGAQDGTGLPATTLTTLASAIRDAASSVAEAAPDSRVQADQAVGVAPDGPMRVLRIQLRPEELGTVTVELRLANGQLETHLRAARPETAALLHRDSAILTDLLKQAHYQAEVTVGQARPSDGGGSSGGSPAQGQPTFGQGGARPGQGGERQRQAEQHQAAGRRDGERTDETIRPRDGGVYL
ncbi:MAG: flagellar hook-length control protein FliK [Actinomycetospora chiangmaiensis]|nr:flagellar hook-length control protein FliK [Actinomycetospora chiangmaiensis]